MKELMNINKGNEKMNKQQTITLDGVKYVREDSIKNVDIDLSNIVLIRTYSAGVHMGTLKEHDRSTNHVVLTNAKRLHAWSGACSLSQVAIDGIDLSGSRIAISVPEITLGRVIEIIPMSKKAATQIFEAKEWKK